MVITLLRHISISDALPRTKDQQGLLPAPGQSSWMTFFGTSQVGLVQADNSELSESRCCKSLIMLFCNVVGHDDAELAV